MAEYQKQPNFQTFPAMN